MKLSVLSRLVPVVVFVVLQTPVSALAESPPLFDGPYNYTPASRAVVAGDFTGDGTVDLVVGSSSGVSVLAGNGAGGFASAITYPAGAFFGHLVTGDFNRDGHLDVAVTNATATPNPAAVSDPTKPAIIYPGRVAVLLNAGNGTFLAPASFGSGGDSPVGLVTGDFNNDGKVDLAVANGGTPTVCAQILCLVYPCPCRSASLLYDNANVGVLTGTGYGAFSLGERSLSPYATNALAKADFNNDGKLDIVESIKGLSSANNLFLLLGWGNGAFQGPFSGGITVTSSPERILPVDLNGDQIQDLVLVDSSGIKTHIGLGNAQFQQGNSYAVASAADVAAGDFNGDGNTDVAVVKDTGTNLLLYQGNGNGTLAAPQTFTVGTTPAAVCAADLDSDGTPDLAAATGSGTSVLLNTRLKVVTPTSASFSGMKLNTPSTPKSFTIANTTAAPLNVSGISLSGAGSAMFDVVTGGVSPCPAVPFTLQPEQSCTVQILFTPTAYDAQDAILAVTSDHPVTPTSSASLTGQAAPYVLTMLWSGAGSGSIVITPGNYTHSSGPAYRNFDLTAPTTLQLQAQAAPGAVLSGWTGCDSVTDTTCTIVMASADRTVTVNFKLIPVATIGSRPATVTSATDATFTIGGTNVHAYKYAVDSGAYSDEINVAAPILISDLGEGIHTVSILGRDSAGTWQVTPTTATWTVDLSPPTAVVDGTPAAITSTAGATLRISGSGVVSYRYALDGGAYSSAFAVAAPITLSGLGEGQHTVEVIGNDSAGNWQVIPTTATWIIDVTPPTAVVDGISETTIRVAVASLSISGTGVVTYKYALDGGTYSSELSVGTPIALSGLGDGPHSVEVIGKDSAGNWQTTPTTLSWTVDSWPVTVTGAGDFVTVTDAYNALPGDSVLRIKVMELLESLVFNRDINVTLRGGYDPASGASVGVTTLRGSLEISNGTVEVENLVLMAAI